MTKKTKDETLDLFYFNADIENETIDKEQNKKKKVSQNKKSNQKKNEKKALSNKSKNKNKNKNQQNQEKSTKDERFDFDEEIIIGLKRIDPPEDKQVTKKRKKVSKKQPVKQNKFKEMQKPKKNIQKKLTPQQERAKKKRKAIFRMTKWLMLIAIIIGGGIYALLSPIFNVENIQVVGNSKVETEEVISLSGIVLDHNMFSYQSRDIIQKIKENAYIATVQVNHKIPDTIEIVVTERKPRFILQVANAYAYISTQGYILEISNQKPLLPILVGFSTEQENIQVGYRLCTDDLEKLGDALKIMEAATSNKLAHFITQINIADKDNYILTLQQKKKIVHLGDTSNLSTKMLWILKFNELEGNAQGEIILNMNLNDEKNKPYFRKTV